MYFHFNSTSIHLSLLSRSQIAQSGAIPCHCEIKLNSRKFTNVPLSSPTDLHTFCLFPDDQGQLRVLAPRKILAQGLGECLFAVSRASYQPGWATSARLNTCAPEGKVGMIQLRAQGGLPQPSRPIGCPFVIHRTTSPPQAQATFSQVATVSA